MKPFTVELIRDTCRSLYFDFDTAGEARQVYESFHVLVDLKAASGVELWATFPDVSKAGPGNVASYFGKDDVIADTSQQRVADVLDFACGAVHSHRNPED